ncbi:MBL fold metallo-hydrolase [Leifsonia poae]|uniref:MBL fold metallo-hydrolase n=1 Tax=Leifsonia poae TaxID=110933 RepID=A0A9W6M0E5_9MICO|nr:MBL fold metallo-hydrolase [Leifsonia poae]GLJ76574.1 MBL fold metallo-hydrolase [Leifsonia poae]
MKRCSEVAPGVFVATSRKMLTTSTMLVGQGDALLIDPAWLPDELDAIAASIRERQLNVVGGFATHAHYDHLLWHPGFGEAPRWASAKTAQLADLERPALVKQLGAGFPRQLVNVMGRVRAVDGRIPAASVPDGFEVELIVHDAHAPGHTALWLPRQRVLIAGDMLSDVELPLPYHPDNLPLYVDALDLLSPIVEQARVVVPGHGNVGNDARARLDADRRYIDELSRRGTSDDVRVRNSGMAEAHENMRRLLQEADTDR